VFAWTYEDLSTYDTTVIEHKIPLKEEAKPFRQKLRQDKSYVASYYGEGSKEVVGCPNHCSLEIL
jgi:hypothetical protein